MLTSRSYEFCNVWMSNNFTKLLRKFCTLPSSKVRVRFAPSPTGHLHLGGLRTALYNYLFSRSRGGSFVLRLEDTDQSRLLPGAAENLELDLAWAGIPPDESPARGGPFGPYTQSQRLHLYREHVERILQSGAAYHCFCSERRLDLLRREALRARQVPRYDNRCRHLPHQQVEEKFARGDQFCIRFKLVPSSEPFPDLVYGPIAYDVAQNEGDPIIVKSDGFPTYHFANVVDDHLMEISHVLRGVEWQMSTPKHLLLYKALGWEPPQFGHLPLILNPDGTKLSKRQGDIRVAGVRERGIFPLALLNYVTHAGGGFNRNLYRAKPRIYSLSELSSVFDLGRMNAHSCRLAPDKLPEFNRLELQRQLASGEDEDLVRGVQDLVATTLAHRGLQLRLEEDHVRAVLRWGQTRVHSLHDLVEEHLAFLWLVPAPASHLQHAHAEVLKTLQAEVASMSDAVFEKEQLNPWLRQFADSNGMQFHELMKLLRSVLSGLKEGPGVAEMMDILGRSETASRLERSVATSESPQAKTYTQ